MKRLERKISIDLSNWEWTCACCGERKRGVPDFGYDAPIHHQWAEDGDPEFRIISKDSDLCEMEIAGQLCYFVRCILRVPVAGSKTGLGFGVWASLSEDSFARYRDSYDDPDQSRIGPMFGYLANRLPVYPDTLGLKADVCPQDANQRPLIRLWNEAADHPLFIDQDAGVGIARLTELLSQMLPCDGRA